MSEKKANERVTFDSQSKTHSKPTRSNSLEGKRTQNGKKSKYIYFSASLAEVFTLKSTTLKLQIFNYN